MFVFHAGASYQPLAHEVDSDSIYHAVDNQATPTDTNKYVLAFLAKSLYWRQVQSSALTDYLDAAITKLWKEVISQLKDTGRKLINIESG